MVVVGFGVVLFSSISDLVEVTPQFAESNCLLHGEFTKRVSLDGALCIL